MLSEVPTKYTYQSPTIAKQDPYLIIGIHTHMSSLSRGRFGILLGLCTACTIPSLEATIQAQKNQGVQRGGHVGTLMVGLVIIIMFE